MKQALFLPPFDELADPNVLVEIAVAAEAAGWDGLFLWDHVNRPEVRPVADPWIALAAVAAATDQIRIGTMVTPLTRRRPQVLARQTVTLDVLSGGRLTLGVGLGVDTGRELSAFGEVVDPVTRGERLDEALDVLCGLWAGAAVSHQGEHFVADDVTFVPGPVQQPRIPIWCAARTLARRPLRRAARFDGLFPIELGPDEIADVVGFIERERGSLDGFDVATWAMLGADVDAYRRAGVTWWLESILPGEPVDDVMQIASHPPRSD